MMSWMATTMWTLESSVCSTSTSSATHCDAKGSLSLSFSLSLSLSLSPLTLLLSLCLSLSSLQPGRLPCQGGSLAQDSLGGSPVKEDLL